MVGKEIPFLKWRLWNSVKKKKIKILNSSHFHAQKKTKKTANLMIRRFSVFGGNYQRVAMHS